MLRDHCAWFNVLRLVGRSMLVRRNETMFLLMIGCLFAGCRRSPARSPIPGEWMLGRMDAMVTLVMLTRSFLRISKRTMLASFNDKPLAKL